MPFRCRLSRPCCSPNRASLLKIASYVRGLVGGLIAAKVLLSVDMLPFFDAFPDKPMIFNVGWKTTLYTGGVLGFL